MSNSNNASRYQDKFLDKYWPAPCNLIGVFTGAALIQQGSPVLGSMCLVGGIIGFAASFPEMNRSLGSSESSAEKGQKDLAPKP